MIGVLSQAVAMIDNSMFFILSPLDCFPFARLAKKVLLSLL